MSGALKGTILGVANTVVVAFCIAVTIEPDHVLDATIAISFMGCLPALVVGAMLGHCSERMQTTNRRVLLAGMIAVACSAVGFLGILFGLPSYVLVACIPTAAACLILERWTRAQREELPLARVA